MNDQNERLLAANQSDHGGSKKLGAVRTGHTYIQTDERKDLDHSNFQENDVNVSSGKKHNNDDAKGESKESQSNHKEQWTIEVKTFFKTLTRDDKPKIVKQMSNDNDTTEIIPLMKKSNELIRRLINVQQTYHNSLNSNTSQNVTIKGEDEDKDDEENGKYSFTMRDVSPNLTVEQLKHKIVQKHRDKKQYNRVMTRRESRRSGNVYYSFDLAYSGKQLKNGKRLEDIEELRDAQDKIINVVVPWKDSNNDNDDNKFEIYQSSKIHIKEVNLKEAQFRIQLEMRLFWNDSNLVNMYMYSYLYDKDDKRAMEKFLQKDFFVNNKGKVKRYWMPFFSFKMEKRLINCEQVGEINDLKVKIHNFKNHHSVNKNNNSNGMAPVPHLELNFEGALTEPLELDDYPFDKQFLHLQFFFNKRSQSKYKIVHATQANEWMNVKRHGRDIPLTLKKSDSVADYEIVRDKMTDDEQKRLWKITDDLYSKNYYKYELPHDYDVVNKDGKKCNIREYRLIRIRLIRNSTADFVRYVLALLFLILSPLSLLACDYHEDFGDIISNTIALLFTLVAAHYLLMDNLPSVLSFLDVIIIAGYISIISWLVLVPFAELTDHDWYMYAAGLISVTAFLFVMILILWKWCFNRSDSASGGETNKCAACCTCCACSPPRRCIEACPSMKIFRVASWEHLAEEELEVMHKFYENQKKMGDVQESAH